MNNIADIGVNTGVFLVTLVLAVLFFRKDGKWDAGRGKYAFRFFTCQSNVLCAAACLLTAVGAVGGGEIPVWIRIVKFVGTASVTVTMLTVFLFLAPSVGKGWMKTLLTGRVSDFFMHLVTPLLAIFSLCVFERWEISLPQCLWGMAPVILYGALYIYKTIILPEGKGWEDFYGFNRGGKWPASLAAMTAGTFLICLGLRTLVIL